tara:strand:- start:860 stop:1060 length:201 start_codon:yes stop_codon:yes gene_type:complete
MTIAYLTVHAYPETQRDVVLTETRSTGDRADHVRAAAALRDRFPCADRIVAHVVGGRSFVVRLGAA